MKNFDIRRLEQEVGLILSKVAEMVGPERLAAAERLRGSLVASGKWQESSDSSVIEKFAAGVVGLDELPRHFYGRL